MADEPPTGVIAEVGKEGVDALGVFGRQEIELDLLILLGGSEFGTGGDGAVLLAAGRDGDAEGEEIAHPDEGGESDEGSERPADDAHVVRLAEGR
jgi:hypothetical protein